MNRQFEELLDRLKLNNLQVEEVKLRHAYEFCMKAHGSQLRASGDPYYTHPLAVAQILADLNLDQSTVITGLLHDTVEDTLATLDDIEEQFGKDIAGLVDGVTKLSQLELQSEHTKQAENLRKLVLAMSTDIRVLLVKLADRLHNMRTLHHVSSVDKRKRVARETIEIYAPLAERMGMQYLKDELEDIAFGVMNPDARESVQSRLSFLYENADYTVEAIIDDIQRVLKAGHLENAEVNGRQKTPYSIWKKMQHKRVAFEQLSDIMAFRIVVGDVGNVYQALGAVHNAYLVLPGRFKDYISTPKPNGYQSLHTGLIGPFNSRIEVQIRTKDMHLIAEYGIASHWEYKQEAAHDGRQYAWLRGLLDILDQASNPEEFLENTKLEMFQDQVFCFTPKGDLIQLPGGATPVDFAYAVHSEVGNHITASKINGRLMPLRTVLNNGDQVEVITSKTQNPSPTWERFVVTGKARSHIRKFIRQQRREQFSELGRSMLHKAFKQAHFDIGEKILRSAVEQLKQGALEELYASVGEGTISVQEVLTIAGPVGKVEPIEPKTKKIKHSATSEGDSVSIQGLIAGMAVRYAGCCHPLPGDRISGIVKTGKGITIHTVDCDVLKAFSDPNRVLDLSWGKTPDENHRFVGRLKATFLNKTGSLSSFSTAISKQGGNIANIKVTNRTPDFWDIMIDVEVRDAEHLNLVIASVRTLSITNSVERL
ncbi:RelA/SpoT family protein [Candidatus Odyssella acanthamoebae]|uniref:GTP pyrophosphokinase rsh n=1 Tax=Candidatus Odyssella acanthamoebae TaxID=91604 RepID=A0A077AVG0_9PROT|nr:bifunctional (p)ppGpp synthetase/guanosine-3',5'-bis(diphosphate) 3'-pyrophosphohydrolase [Candidatus Paracaedibacter acanthamoebae]AIK96386.1 GTP pyrophosphokinase [Candidatus Paracaedibacter acanthamoebae]